MLENIKQDYYRSIYFGKKRRRKPKATILRILFRAFKYAGFRAVFFYRLGRWCRDKRFRLMAAFVERLMFHRCHCWISTFAKIGPGLVIPHCYGITIGPDSVLGKNCYLLQHITIGDNHGKVGKDGSKVPVIGDNVEICAGAAVLGPISVGSNSIVGANATLTTSVPENSVVGTFRAEVLAECSPERRIIHSGQRIALSRRELFDWIEKLEKRIEELEKKTN